MTDKGHDYRGDRKSLGNARREGRKKDPPVGGALFNIMQHFAIKRSTEVGDTKEEVHVYM